MLWLVCPRFPPDAQRPGGAATFPPALQPPSLCGGPQAKWLKWTLLYIPSAFIYAPFMPLDILQGTESMCAFIQIKGIEITGNKFIEQGFSWKKNIVILKVIKSLSRKWFISYQWCFMFQWVLHIWRIFILSGRIMDQTSVSQAEMFEEAYIISNMCLITSHTETLNHIHCNWSFEIQVCKNVYFYLQIVKKIKCGIKTKNICQRFFYYCKFS